MIFAIGGVILISLDKEFTANKVGVILVVVSAFTAALYKVSVPFAYNHNLCNHFQVLFKKINGDATLSQVSLFMTILGLIDLTLNLIPTIILVLTKVEKVGFAYIPWWPLIGSALLGLCKFTFEETIMVLVFNFLVNFGIALLNPLVISIGMLCGIPLNAGKLLSLTQ